MSKKIEGNEIKVRDLFDSERFFHIPEYQRAFSWEKENFEKLFTDILQEIKNNIESLSSIPSVEEKREFVDCIQSFEPYFLGSVILQTDSLENDEAKNYGIVDGQQRIISLSILLAVLRDLETGVGSDLQKKLYQEANPMEGISESKPRIELKNYDSYIYQDANTSLKEFYDEHILTEGGTKKVLELEETKYKESIQHVIEAVKVFRKGLKGESNKFINLYIGYLLWQVVLVEVKTISESSAFRLFNVLNTRGMPLSNADILKSLNLREVPSDQREEYTRTWERLEEEFGSDGLERMIGLMRAMKAKEKAQKSIHEEFTEKIFEIEAELKGKRFIAELAKITDIYREKIYNPDLNQLDTDQETYYHNLMSLMFNYIPYKDWMAAVIKFQLEFDNEEHLFEFIKKLEARLAVDWVGELSFNDRLNTIYELIKTMEKVENPEKLLENPLLNSDLKQLASELESGLNHHRFYSKGRYQKPKYVLLRIDMERHYNRNKKIDVVGNINVEHILPQTPNSDYWTSRFTDQQVREWKHRLGNLTLLDKRKNYRVSNKPFPKKVEEYFLKRSEFSVTEELEDYEEWGLSNLKARHENLISEAKEIWIENQLD